MSSNVFTRCASPGAASLSARGIRVRSIRRRGYREFRSRLELDEFDVKTERLQLADKHVERFRDARLDSSLALDDGLVNLGTAIDVVGLRRQQFLQDVSGAV